VFDLRRVKQVDAGAFEILINLVAMTRAGGAVAILADIPVSALVGDNVPPAIASLRSFRDVDSALEWCEDQLLESLAFPSEPTEAALSDHELLSGISPDMLEVIVGQTERQTFPAGTIFSEGDAADRMFLLISGRVSVHLRVGEGSRRIATFGPGSVFGEMAMLDDGVRSSSVQADEDAVCQVLFRDVLSRLESGGFPALTSILYRNLAKSLSRRLRDTNEELRSLD